MPDSPRQQIDAILAELQLARARGIAPYVERLEYQKSACERLFNIAMDNPDLLYFAGLVAHEWYLYLDERQEFQTRELH